MKARRIPASDSGTERGRIARPLVALTWLLIAAAVASVAQAQAPRAKFDTFAASIDGYNQAVQRRASDKNSDAESRLRESTRQLRTAGAAYAESVRDGTGEADRQKIVKDLEDYEDAGARLVTVADDQRALAIDYSNRCAAMEARAHGSIDGAAKAFGHVFARKSLIALDAQIAELRDRAPNLAGARGRDLEAIEDALAKMEAAIAATLGADERGLARSQGEKWITAMRNDLEWLSASRPKLMTMDGHQGELMGRLAELRTRLGKRPIVTELTASEAPTAAEPVDDVRSSDSSSEAPSGPIQQADAVAESSAAESSDTKSSDATVQPSPADQDGEVNVRWIIGGIALLTFVLVGGGLAMRRRRNVQPTTVVAATVADVGATVTELQPLPADRDATVPDLQLPPGDRDATVPELQLPPGDCDATVPDLQALAADRDATVPELQALAADHDMAVPDLHPLPADRDAVVPELEPVDRDGTVPDWQPLPVDRDATVPDLQPLPVDCDAAVLESTQPLPVDPFTEPAIDGVETEIELTAADEDESEYEQLMESPDDEAVLVEALAEIQPTPLDSTGIDERNGADSEAVHVDLRPFDPDEFELVFQPELGLPTFAVESVDALVVRSQPDARTATSERLPIGPDELTADIGNWALCTALDAVACWRHGNWQPVRINVSVATQQLREPRFVDSVTALLDEYRLPPSCLEFGIREAALRDGEQSLATLRQLRALGTGIALTDFGAGYLPLESLQQYPLTRIRLDRTLATDLNIGSRMLTIARNVTGWSKDLGLSLSPNDAEQLARRLCETHLCELRHYVRCDLPDDQAGSVDAAEPAGIISYESCIGFRESFIVKSTMRASVDQLAAI